MYESKKKIQKIHQECLQKLGATSENASIVSQRLIYADQTGHIS